MRHYIIRHDVSGFYAYEIESSNRKFEGCTKYKSYEDARQVCLIISTDGPPFGGETANYYSDPTGRVLTAGL